MAMRSSSRSGHSADELEKMFSKFDKNGDGKISISELGSVMEALGSTLSDTDLKSEMNDFDKNGDGFIDMKEFAEFFGGSADEKELREAFRLYDRNGNGIELDADGDGCVNFEEFQKMMKGGGVQNRQLRLLESYWMRFGDRNGPLGSMIQPGNYYGREGHLSTKSDVYSFGIIMMDVINYEDAHGRHVQRRS